MLVIRFSRVGRHNHAQYRIVVQEKSKAPTGRHVAIVGSYDPHSKQVVLKEDKIKEFLANGAQMSDSVYNLFVSNGIVEGKKRVVRVPAKKVEENDESADDAAEQKEESSDTKEQATEDAGETKEEVKKEAESKE